MNWIAILSAVLALARALADWMHDKKLLDTATNAAVAQGLKNAVAAIETSTKAREDKRGELARDPGSVMHDDEFKRPGD